MRFNQYDADMLTFGHYLARTMQLQNVSNDFYKELAEKYCQMFNVGQDVRRTIKRLLVGEDADASLELVRFILEYNSAEKVISNPIRMTNGQAVCKLTVFKNTGQLTAYEYPFYVSDFSWYCNTFVVLDGFESVGEGAGKLLLEKILQVIKEPILLQAGFIHYGDYEVEYRDGSNSGIPEKLVSYYESLGFKNVNNCVGQYEESVIMLKSDKDVFTKKMQSF